MITKKKITDPTAKHNNIRSIRNNVSVPKYELPEGEMDAGEAYNIIHNELMLDGNARLNLATFVTTWMEPEAEKLMAETFDKNMIDKDEYPQTAMLEERCINIISRLFNAPEEEETTGSSAIGSSEAVMLAGMAFKRKWRDRQRAAGKSTENPNLVLGTNVQVVWEKFCRYWDVEPRYIPMKEGKYVITADEVVDVIDENTIGVVAILGTTFTGEFEPIESIHDAMVKNNKEKGFETPLHIDAASGGFVAPFIHPDLKWDFRLPLVKSINASGHKYGLVYPGVGWVVWRDKSELPEDLIFHVNYLGGDMPTFTLNFSRPGNQIVGQYYNFIRLGRDGYTQVMTELRDIAMRLSSGIKELGHFELLSDGSTIPVFAFSVLPGANFSVYDMSSKLRERGWLVPAYTMPAEIEDKAVLRIVIREGFNSDMGEMLLDDIKNAAEDFISRGVREKRTEGGSFAH
ncbi:glutamate decarboxylase [Flammeovirga kamogawensis]|uniref:Glutamate decarboxylase n=1 Tax=Flammeovirga kamogawensis TaxID=373891 RepID=A0ABX8H025_9BACT|nr:glutamate decarboxylase [Flammeovirga kamogawensis]MBB6459281.1 glutamate decarboxylase [Flammeovirga kamogawensis]QWG08841.1 glutamate decarboxylase [Flammeovirga kamogawensis]TRX67131.1 glutamate decarboxylase [Flammeovirga kamogawensis]